MRIGSFRQKRQNYKKLSGSVYDHRTSEKWLHKLTFLNKFLTEHKG